MSTKTVTTDPGQLRRQAEELQRQAADAQALVDQAAQQARQREQARMAATDREFVQNYNAHALDQAITDARLAVEQAVADMPVTQAMSAYLVAQWHRNWAQADLAAAKSRLGLPHQTEAAAADDSRSLVEYVTGIATASASAQIAAERAQMQG